MTWITATSPRRLVVTLGFIALAVGCASAEPYAERELVELPERFDDGGVGDASALPDRWWTSLNDPALDALVEEALASNLTLQTAWDRLAQAEASARLAGVNIYPNVSAQVGAGHNFSNVPVREGSNFSLGLSASYEVDLWGRIGSAREAAALDALATERSLQAAAISLSAEVATAWYSLVEARGQLALLDRQQETNQQVLDLVTLRLTRGQASSGEVFQQRRQMESVRGNQAQLRAQIEVLEHRLAILLGRPPTADVAAPVEALIELPALPSAGVPAELVQRRPDVQSAFLRVKAADQRVASAVAAQFPRLSLSASANTNAVKPQELFDNWLINLAGNLAVPLFNAGQLKIEVERAEANASESLHAYGQAVLTALGEVEDALAQERRQRELIVSLEEQLTLAQAALDRARLDYLNGASSYIGVLDFLRTVQTLERNRLDAQQLLIQYRINLCRALGGGWEMTRRDNEDGEGEGER